MKPYEHIREFTIRYCDVDFKDELKVSSALEYFEEVASSSADELGFGFDYIKSLGLAFILSSTCCEFLKPVPVGECARFVTWPTPPSHVVLGREYQIYSQAGELLANASSRWCLLDLTSGKIEKASVIDNQDYTTYNTKKLFEGLRWKVPAFKMEEGEREFSITIANSEYDHNFHVNNTRYASYCLNCFSVEELKTMRVKRFMISYVKQCKEGETLRFYRKKVEDGSYLVSGFNEKNEVVTQTQIWFEESSELL